MQEEGLTNEGRHHLLLLRKQVHDKRGIAESLHAQITRARLTACEVGVFSREISQLSKIRPHPSFRSHLSSSPMGVFSRDYGSSEQPSSHLMLTQGVLVAHWKKVEVDLTQDGLSQLQDLGLNCLPLLPQCRPAAFATQSSNKA